MRCFCRTLRGKHKSSRLLCEIRLKTRQTFSFPFHAIFGAALIRTHHRRSNLSRLFGWDVGGGAADCQIVMHRPLRGTSASERRCGCHAVGFLHFPSLSSSLADPCPPCWQTTTRSSKFRETFPRSKKSSAFSYVFIVLRVPVFFRYNICTQIYETFILIESQFASSALNQIKSLLIYKRVKDYYVHHFCSLSKCKSLTPNTFVKPQIILLVEPQRWREEKWLF